MIVYLKADDQAQRAGVLYGQLCKGMDVIVNDLDMLDRLLKLLEANPVPGVFFKRHSPGTLICLDGMRKMRAEGKDPRP